MTAAEAALLPPEERPEWYHRYEPFEEGNTAAVTHGAKSPRIIAPLALQVIARAKARPDWPAWLNDTSYTEEIWSWAWCEAVLELYRRELMSLDNLTELRTERSNEQEDVTVRRGSKQRKLSSEKRRSLEDGIMTWTRLAKAHRTSLGLDPLSRSRIGRDTAAAKLDLATLWSRLEDEPELQQAEDKVDKVLPAARPVDEEFTPHVPDRYRTRYNPKTPDISEISLPEEPLPEPFRVDL